MAKKKADVMEKEKNYFIYGNEEIGVEGCIKRGIPEEVAIKIFDDMTDFAKSDKEMQISIDMNAVKTDSNWEAETKVSDKYKKVSPEDVLSKIMNM